ncbi:MAG: undecaprenyldiphospho-muramoylpentapeptide beta-N-acetylglucosaminyltransferase [Candidatus Omnitrophota bacterium]
MRVLIACGGTAGHIFPGAALAEELKKYNEHSHIVLVVSGRARDKEYLEAAKFFLKGVALEHIISAPLPYTFSWKLIPFGFKLLAALTQSLVIVLRHRPYVVVGFGGYISFAPVCIARILRIPTLIHEQNLIPGRANHYLTRWVKKIATSFEETKRYFSAAQLENKIVHTGLPLRRDFVLTMDSAGLRHSPQDKEKCTILVVGGSQGAQAINALVLESISKMSREQLAKIRVIHLTGKSDYRLVKNQYDKLALEHLVYDFFEDMPSVYRIADLIIGRSGASTIFEAACFGLPCILIPYPHGTLHQKENALFLQRRGAALMLDEGTARAQDLQKMILELIENPDARHALSKSISSLRVPNARKNLIDLVYSLRKE